MFHVKQILWRGKRLIHSEFMTLKPLTLKFDLPIGQCFTWNMISAFENIIFFAILTEKNGFC